MNRLMTFLLAIVLLLFAAPMARAETGSFSPIAPTVNIPTPATTSSGAIALGVPTNDLGSKVVRVANDTDHTIFISFGSSGVAANASTSIPVLSKITETFEIGNAASYVDAVTGSGTASGSIYFTLGRGQ